jgi:arsenite-transporting ATPase
MNSLTQIGNLSNILEQTSLKWIFVGGKGGVGKTTISSSLAILLSQKREKVLIVSTDPAHNISDSFNQKLGNKPTKINNFTNLFGMELDPKAMNEDDEPDNFNFEQLGLNMDVESKKLLDDFKDSIPGADEALCISMLLQTIDQLEFSTIIFDTAPTGHTLRLLSFPQILDDFLSKIEAYRNNIPMLNTLLQSNMAEGLNQIFELTNSLKNNIVKIQSEFNNKEHTTFIAVCIPEFLSMYETERLLQELNKNKIDCHNIVINQVLFIDKLNEGCDMCNARYKMQYKYINDIKELYDENLKDNDDDDELNTNKFKISILPLQTEEVRGYDKLNNFLKFLITN